MDNILSIEKINEYFEYIKNSLDKDDCNKLDDMVVDFGKRLAVEIIIFVKNAKPFITKVDGRTYVIKTTEV